MIPHRFIEEIDGHLLGNMLEIKNYPLIMAIIGRPGVGKTYPLRKYLSERNFYISSVSAADLESERAGEPAKLLQHQYVEASKSISSGKPAVLLIDDIDTTLGEWEQNTGTVNHQDILAFLMHIADDPTCIDGVGSVNRVPIFVTGNYFDRMYQPLVREGRVIRFDWEPTMSEKIQIVQDILPGRNYSVAKEVVEAYPDKTIAFFSSLIAQKQMEMLRSIAWNLSYERILADDRYCRKLKQTVEKEKNEIFGDPQRILKIFSVSDEVK